ncbi:MAG TPA: hypothetical protein VFZ15_10235 [Acidimicrobiia bacterium]|nr:hypothetical protein [Acidimicrobiia bacterium]
MGESRPRSWVVQAVVVGLVVAACGGTSAEVSEFCESVVATEATISEGPGEDVAGWAGQVTETLTELEQQAPDEVAGAVSTITGILLPAIESGSEEELFNGLESTEFREAAEVVDGYMVDECGWQVTDVTAVDYQFETDLSGLEAGYNGFAFANGGTEMHEMALIRFNDDTTETIEELLELPEEEAFSKITMPGGSFAMPEESDTLFVDLEPGRYAIACFLPVGATPENIDALESGELDGPPHFSQGMVQEFTIEG